MLWINFVLITNQERLIAKACRPIDYWSDDHYNLCISDWDSMIIERLCSYPFFFGRENKGTHFYNYSLPNYGSQWLIKSLSGLTTANRTSRSSDVAVFWSHVCAWVSFCKAWVIGLESCYWHWHQLARDASLYWLIHLPFVDWRHKRNYWW